MFSTTPSSVGDDRTQDKLMQEAFRLQDQADRMRYELALERRTLAHCRIIELGRRHRLEAARAGGRLMAAAMHERALEEARGAVAAQRLTVHETLELVRDMDRSARIRFEAADASAICDLDD